MSDIRTLRQQRGLGLRELAKIANVSLTELTRCERGLILPNKIFFEAIATVLDVNFIDLINYHEVQLRKSTPGEGYTTARPSQGSVYGRSQPLVNNAINVVDLFCGTGGFSHGFERAKDFQVTLGIDLLADRTTTFIANHPKATAILNDIRTIDINLVELHSPLPDIIIGGPPCQGFSSIRPFRTLTEKDPRNNLFEAFVLVVNRFKPKWFVLENVVGLLTHERGDTLKTIIQLFQQIGYTITWKILNTALYGLPQRRERLIIIGNKEGKTFNWPAPTHYFNGRSMAGKAYGQRVSNMPLFEEKLEPAVSVMEAIHDLSEIEAGGSSNQYRQDIQPTAYELLMRGNNHLLTLHEATNHSEKMLQIIRNAGHNRSALPKGMTSSGFSSSYSRLEPNLPSVTLTVNFVHPASNKCIHPFQDRALTPREGARLQGFADSYIFRGSRAQIVKQIGNAVPPLLGKIIAEALLKQF